MLLDLLVEITDTVASIVAIAVQVIMLDRRGLADGVVKVD